MIHPRPSRRVVTRVWPGLVLALAAACTMSDSDPSVSRAAPPDPVPQAQRDSDGRCYAAEVTPAIYEQVMGMVQVVQAEIAEDGTVIRPPIYRKAPVPKVVVARGEMRFAAPCPEAMTPDFIASVQRALSVRGYHDGAITGVIDRPTQAAIRRYQAQRGLDSAQLSLETARTLGLVAVPREAG